MKYSKEEVKLLDDFAKAALMSILRHESTYTNNTSDFVAHWSYEYAQAMLETRMAIVE